MTKTKMKIKYTKEYLEKLDEKLRLVPLTYDFSFKRMFASERDRDYLVLKMFLIAVLRLKIDPYKCNISVRCSELPKENIKEYRKTLDINVILNNNLHLDIELNNTKYNKIVTRNGLYESKLFTMAFESGAKTADFLNQYVCQLNLNNYEKIHSDNMIEKLEGEDIIASTSIKTGNIILLNSNYSA